MKEEIEVIIPKCLCLHRLGGVKEQGRDHKAFGVGEKGWRQGLHSPLKWVLCSAVAQMLINLDLVK